MFSEPFSSLSLRAHSPSPRRNRMNLIEEYSEYDTDVTNLSQSEAQPTVPQHPLLNKTAREIELTYKNEETIPDTPHYELPSDFNEATERRKAEHALIEEKIEAQLKCFYKEMNETALAHGMKSSHF